MKIKIIAILSALALVSGLLYFSLHTKSFYYTGTIENTQVHVSARVTSIVENITKNEGDVVKKDEPLVQLKCEDIKLLKSQLEKDFKRAQNLKNKGVVSEEAFDSIKIKYDDILIKLDWCTLKSPLDGILLYSYKEIGEFIAPGIKIFTILNPHETWAWFYVPETLLKDLKLKQKVSGFLPEDHNIKFNGEIVRINEKAEFTPKSVQTPEEKTRLVFGIKVQFENKDLKLKSGMPVLVEF